MVTYEKKKMMKWCQIGWYNRFFQHEYDSINELSLFRSYFFFLYSLTLEFAFVYVWFTVAEPYVKFKWIVIKIQNYWRKKKSRFFSGGTILDYRLKKKIWKSFLDSSWIESFCFQLYNSHVIKSPQFCLKKNLYFFSTLIN